MNHVIAQTRNSTAINSIVEQARAEGWYAWLIVGAIVVVIVLGFTAYKLGQLMNDR